MKRENFGKASGRAMGLAAAGAACCLAACGGGGVGGPQEADGAVWLQDVRYESGPELWTFPGGDDQGGAERVFTDLADAWTFAACTTGSECPTGFCVEAPDGSKVCAPDCVEGVCPPGWACKQVANIVGDIVFVCLPEVQRLCRPCRMSEECRPTGVVTGDLCVRFGDLEGAFCGQDCADSKACPVGYECREVEAPDGGQAWQCLPQSGECECTADFIEAGYETDCVRANEHGQCRGSRRCTKDGLSPCDAPVPEAERCDGADNECDGDTDEEGAQGCAPYYLDEDGDGVGTTSDSRCLCGPASPYSAKTAGDCDDQTPTVGPGAQERCDGVDNDCDGDTDEEGAEGCTPHYLDQDGDGVGSASDSRCLCGPASPYSAKTAGDCDDQTPTVGPGVQERCDGVDNDCDGDTDEGGGEGCQTYFYDGDGDGWGLGTTFECLCAPKPPYAATKVTDCNDADSEVNPGAIEACNVRDDNCNGQTDEGLSRPCSTMCGSGTETCSGGQWVNCTAPQPITCLNYDNCQVGPMCVATCPSTPSESCNGRDDNCNGQTDEGLSRPCSTMCGPGTETCSGGQWVNCTAPQPKNCMNYNSCQVEAMCVSSCPGAPAETCANGKDDNCNGQTDEGCQPTYKIGINPDDGGGTGACGCSGICEDNLNLSMGLHLRDFLNADTGNTSGGGTWQVFMTRTDNSNPSLASRVAYLNNNGVHRAVSISCNTYGTCSNSAVGTETYKKSGADSTTNDLASKVQSQVVSHFQTTNRGVKTGDYYVLVNTNMPHVFVFVGFLTNSSEANKLNTDSWRREAALGMLHGIQTHFGYGEFNP